MSDPIDADSFAQLVTRLSALVDQQAASLRALLVSAITGPGPITFSYDAHGGKRLLIANGPSASTIVVHLPQDATVGTVCLVRQNGPAAIKFVADGAATLINRLAHNGTAGPYAGVVVTCEANAGGAHAVWVLEGDTAPVA